MKSEMREFEKKIFSQNGEDGITLKILEIIGTKNNFFVEFGAETTHECNTKILKEIGFSGLWMDGKYEDQQIGLKKEFITAENINELFKKYSVPQEFDVLSIDIDSNDLYVWDRLDKKYQPSLVIIEYCGFFAPPTSIVIKYKDNYIWKGSPLQGASLSALNKVAIKKGYTLIYCEKEGVNAFFIKNEFLDKLIKYFPNHAFGDERKLFQLRSEPSWSFFEPDGSRTQFIYY